MPSKALLAAVAWRLCKNILYITVNMESIRKSITLLLLAFFLNIGFTQQITVAVLPSESTGSSLGNDEEEALTDKMREVALNVLPPAAFVLLKQDVVVRRLGGAENYIKECRESTCIVDLGKKAQVNYVAKAGVGKLGNKMRLKVELYNVSNEGLVGIYNGEADNIYGLIELIDKNVPEVFRKIPGVSRGRGSSPSFAGGISGLKNSADYTINFEKQYLVNLATIPEGAVLSFDGEPMASCVQTPCKAELPEGKVRIVAALEQYERTDTTVSINQNGQNVLINLKPNFGIFEIEQAYLNGIGVYEAWDLTINKQGYSFGTIKLSPGEYAVKLRHSCYEDNVDFKLGINKGSNEAFNMSNHIKLKTGGIYLSTERNGEPVSEPVFVDRQRVGETPFSGSVPLCSYITVGYGMEPVDIRLSHREIVKYTHKMHESNYVAPASGGADKGNWRQALAADLEKNVGSGNKSQLEAEKTSKGTGAGKSSEKLIRFGWNFMLGITVNIEGSSSKLFNLLYPEYNNMGKADWNTPSGPFGGIIAGGLALNLRPSSVMAIVTELNYNFFSSNYCYGDKCIMDSTDYSLWATLYSNTISVPVLLRLGESNGYFFETGFQWNMPFYSSLWLRGDVSDRRDFSEFRFDLDRVLVFGLGYGFSNFAGSGSLGLRCTYNLSKLDKYGTLNGPVSIAFTMHIFY